jgi:shikimate dehydrogenase
MISGKTKIFGIFGHPVEHTFSPGMHNAAFKKLDMDACYVPFGVAPENLGSAVQSINALGLCGLNITVPHKEKVIPYLDELSEEARLIHAVNTIEVTDGKLIGHNTDGRGFLRSLRELAKYDPRGKTFLFIGSGGAARAVAFSLALAGAKKITFRDIDMMKAAALAHDIQSKLNVEAEAISGDTLSSSASEADCLINATPLGLKKTDPLPIQNNLILKKHLIVDLVYNPPDTPLLKSAKARGAKVLPGLGMLLYQGVIAFEIWTGKKAPSLAMKNALTSQLRSRLKVREKSAG